MEINDLINASKSMVEKMHELDVEKRRVNNQDELRQEISTFVATQLDNISRKNLLEEMITKELMEKITLHELSTDELRGLLKDLSTSKASQTTAILEMFKPTQSSNSLMTPPSNNIDDSASIELTREQRNSLDKLSKVLEIMDKRKSAGDD